MSYENDSHFYDDQGNQLPPDPLADMEVSAMPPLPEGYHYEVAPSAEHGHAQWKNEALDRMKRRTAPGVEMIGVTEQDLNFMTLGVDQIALDGIGMSLDTYSGLGMGDQRRIALELSNPHGYDLVQELNGGGEVDFWLYTFPDPNQQQ